MMLVGYIRLFFAVIAATGLLYLPVFFQLKKQGKGFVRQASFLLCFWSLFFIVFCTIILFNLPFSFSQQHILNLQPLQWLQNGNMRQRVATEVVPNIILFIPLGFFLPAALEGMRKWQLTALAAFSVTFCVEFFQYFIGRSCDIDDLMENVLGAIIGYVVFFCCNYFFKNRVWWREFTGETVGRADALTRVST